MWTKTPSQDQNDFETKNLRKNLVPERSQTAADVLFSAPPSHAVAIAVLPEKNVTGAAGAAPRDAAAEVRYIGFVRRAIESIPQTVQENAGEVGQSTRCVCGRKDLLPVLNMSEQGVWSVRTLSRVCAL